LVAKSVPVLSPRTSSRNPIVTIPAEDTQTQPSQSDSTPLAQPVWPSFYNPTPPSHGPCIIRLPRLIFDIFHVWNLSRSPPWFWLIFRRSKLIFVYPLGPFGVSSRAEQPFSSFFCLFSPRSPLAFVGYIGARSCPGFLGSNWRPICSFPTRFQLLLLFIPSIFPSGSFPVGRDSKPSPHILEYKGRPAPGRRTKWEFLLSLVFIPFLSPRFLCFGYIAPPHPRELWAALDG